MEKLKDLTDEQLMQMAQPRPNSPVYGRWMKLTILRMVNQQPGITYQSVATQLGCKSNRGMSCTFKKYINELVQQKRITTKQEQFATSRDSTFLYPADHEEPQKVERPQYRSRELETLRVFRVHPSEIYNYIPRYDYARQGFSRHQPQPRRERVYTFR